MITTKKINASEVRTDTTIVGLDNAYVMDIAEPHPGYMSIQFGSGYPYGLPDDYMRITYSDADGRECYIVVPVDSQIEVAV